MNRYVLQIEYIGLPFHGWQRQNNYITIQSVIENAIYLLTQSNVSLYASGRTDAGVNAIAQVAHFDIDNIYSIDMLIKGINFYLAKLNYNKYIKILAAARVDQSFHARFSCISKTYMYQLCTIQSIHYDNYLYISNKEKENLILYNKYFLGTYDFRNLISRYYKGNTIQTINDIFLQEEENIIRIFITAKSFLYNQVRYMVSSMLYQKNIGDLFSKKPKIIKSHALYLYSVEYNNNLFRK